MKNRAVFITLGTAMLAVSLLSGCTAHKAKPTDTPAPASQSKTEACKAIVAELFVVNDGLAKYTPSIGSDPINTAGFITGLSQRLTRAAKDIGNPEVKGPSVAVALQVKDFARDVTAYAHNPTGTAKDKLVADGTTVQAAVVAVQKVCSG